MTKEEAMLKYPGLEIIAGDGEDAYREGEPIVERSPLAVVIEHPTEEKYLLAKWRNGWVGLLTGGVEPGDTEEQTVQREVHEETGYKNVTDIKKHDIVTHSLFFHIEKKVNRLAHYHLMSCKLKDLEQDPVAPEELAIAVFEWVPKDGVEKILTTEEIKKLWRYFIKA